MVIDSGDDMNEATQAGGSILRMGAEDGHSKDEAGLEQYVGSKID